jgi:hypothetical protein
VVIGHDAVFGVGVANGGPDAAAPVALDLVLDVARAGVSVSAAPGWTCNAPVVLAASTTVHCAAATLASGANDGFTVTVPTDRTLGGTAIALSAQVASPMTDPAPANNRGSASVQVTASADLASIVLAPKGPLQAKKPATFAIGIANGGPHDARDAVLVIAVNGPRQIVSSIAGGALACSNATDTPTLSTWTCPAGAWYAAGRFDALTVTVNPAYAAGPALSVGAGFSAATSDPSPGNNQSGAAVKVVGGSGTLQ